MANNNGSIDEVIADGSNNGNHNINPNLDYFDSFPPGYRFCPKDDELVVYYLKKKVRNEPLPPNKITEVNLYKHSPEQLAEKYKLWGEKELYFFTPRDRKYRNGSRPNRAAGDGYWKATGADKGINFKGETVGYRKALVYYIGKPPRGDKSDWIMHEYRVNVPPRNRTGANDMRLDDWVLCRIYKKADKSIKIQQQGEEYMMPNEFGNEPMKQLNFDHNGFMNSTGFTNTYADTQRPLQNGLPEIDPQIGDVFIDNFFKFNDPLEAAASLNYGMMAEPVRVRLPPLLHSTSIDNSSKLNDQRQYVNLNYGIPTKIVEPVSVRPPPSLHSIENISESNYLRQDDPWGSSSRGAEESIWNLPNLDNWDFAPLLDFNSNDYGASSKYN